MHNKEEKAACFRQKSGSIMGNSIQGHFLCWQRTDELPLDHKGGATRTITRFNSVALLRIRTVVAHLLTPGAFNTRGRSAGRAPNQLCGSRTCPAANTRHTQRVGSLHGARPSAPQPKRAQREVAIHISTDKDNA